MLFRSGMLDFTRITDHHTVRDEAVFFRKVHVHSITKGTADPAFQVPEKEICDIKGYLVVIHSRPGRHGYHLSINQFIPYFFLISYAQKVCFELDEAIQNRF